jgi:hypothetical protein
MTNSNTTGKMKSCHKIEGSDDDGGICGLMMLFLHIPPVMFDFFDNLFTVAIAKLALHKFQELSDLRDIPPALSH